MSMMWKKVRWSVLGIALVFVMLNFIPIKYALRTPLYKEKSYLCSYTTATEGNWHASLEDNPYLSEALYLNVYETDDFSALKEVVDCAKGTPINNKYVFYGEIEKREMTEGIFFNWLQSPEWDIVYPIHRDSIRAFIAPQSYLTVFDYDWGKAFSIWIRNR